MDTFLPLLFGFLSVFIPGMSVWLCKNWRSWLPTWFKHYAFKNETNGLATDDQLIEQWKIAQTNIATKPIDLNAAFPVPGAALLPPDKRALILNPKNITVRSLPVDKDGNIIKIPFSVRGKGTMATWTGTWPLVVAGTIYVPSGLSYEFENIILDWLDYNMKNR